MLVRKKVNQEKTKPEKPRCCRRCKRMEWLMVSKAAERSSWRRMEMEPESEASRRSIVTLSSVVSVE